MRPARIRSLQIPRNQAAFFFVVFLRALFFLGADRLSDFSGCLGAWSPMMDFTGQAT